MRVPGLIVLMAALGPLGTAAASEVVVYTARRHGQEPAIEAFPKKTGIQVKLLANVPASLRVPDNRWLGLTGRARTIMYSLLASMIKRHGDARTEEIARGWAAGSRS
jgi:hypothetical protein